MSHQHGESRGVHQRLQCLGVSHTLSVLLCLLLQLLVRHLMDLSVLATSTATTCSKQLCTPIIA